MSPDASNGTTTDSYDVIVIGAGPPGENAADFAVKGGLSAVLVEHELVGGECSYWACMPSKALLRPVEVADASHHLPGVPSVESLDVQAVLDRRDSFTSHRDDSSQVQWAQGAGIDVVRGYGRLSGVREVTVTDSSGAARTLHARHAVVLATGTSATLPPVDGLADAAPWTSRDVTNLTAVPDSIIVMGGGVVACEAATWLAGLGAAVTMVSPEDRLLVKNEPFASGLVADRLREAGVRIRYGDRVSAVEREAPTTTGIGELRGTPVRVTVGNNTLEAAELLVAAGRTPNSADLGLDVVGLPAKGYVEVDDTMLVTGVPGEWLYAIGDLNGLALLTHMGKYQARVCGDVIAARAAGAPTDARRFHATSDTGAVPQVTFTIPQVASVGLTEAQARGHHDAVDTVEYDIASVAGASLTRDDYVGRAKLVVDTDTDTLLGATFVGSDIAELLHSATVAVVGRVPLDVLWHAVPSYPTISEVWLRLLETWRTEHS